MGFVLVTPGLVAFDDIQMGAIEFEQSGTGKMDRNMAGGEAQHGSKATKGGVPMEIRCGEGKRRCNTARRCLRTRWMLKGST
jgi:hypothetical protein